MAAPPNTKPELIVRYQNRSAQFFTEDSLELTAEQTSLEMVLIPAGEFMMGSPKDELGHRDDESPKHKVKIAEPFFMGKYPVTQAQWLAVMDLPQIKQELDPDPAHFKGDNRPVEKVSWYEAVEFCARLQKHTGKPYRLPSEAEWEYACRANTNTPFHFGESITTDLANYRGTDWEIGDDTHSGAYGDGPHGIYRAKTTDVGSLEIANAFGLYDMHGNVWEWCLDHWHKTYDNAPTDGCAWLSVDKSKVRRILRGGSWNHDPEVCRSAFRVNDASDNSSYFIGFRVVCSSARGT